MIKGIVGRLAEGGKIKIGGLGEERKSARGTWRLPVKLDHFIVTSTMRDAKGDLLVDDALMAALPKDPDGKCRAIPVLVHSDNLEEVFPTALALYGGKQLLCRGDGESADRWPFDPSGKRTSDKPAKCQCPCQYLNAETGLKCKAHGTLHCTIAIPGQAVAGAVHLWRTTSMISIQRMIGSIEQIRMACGTIRGVPLVLRVSPVTVSPGGKTSTVYVCHLELRARDLIEAQQHALRLADMRRQVAGELPPHIPLALPAGDDEDEVEAAEVAAEFYPPDPDPADDGRHPIPEAAPAQEPAAEPAKPAAATPPADPPADPAVEKLLAQIATITPARATDATLKWLQVRMGDSYPVPVREAASRCREVVLAARAAAAAERDAPPPGPDDMPPWDHQEPGSRG